MSRSVKKLIDLQVIAKHSSKHYMLNPQYTIRNVNDDYFGLADKFEKLIREDNDEDRR